MMGIFGFLKRKKKDDAAAAAPAADSGGDSSGGGDSGSGSASADVSVLQVEITKIKAQLESFMEIRKSFTERFSTINEQIGEIRGQVMDTNRNLGYLEVKATKAADLVESVHPDKLMIQVQKMDGKIEGVKGIVESKDAMMQNIMEQLKQIRNQMMVFQGIEEVLKLNQEVKEEILTVKKLIATVERHADRVENVFIETQKTFKEFNTFASLLETQKSDMKELQKKIDKAEVSLVTFLKKKDFDDKFANLEKSDKHMKEVLTEVETTYRKLDDKFAELRAEIRGSFDNRLKKAEVLTNALAVLLKDNPLLAKGLDFSKQLQDIIDKAEASAGVDTKGSKDKKADAGKADAGKDAAKADAPAAAKT